MGRTDCCICDSSSEDGKEAGNVSFHRARTTRKRREWLKICKQSGVFVAKRKHLVLCSLHFRPDYIIVDSQRGKNSLTEDAIPSLFVAENITGARFVLPNENNLPRDASPSEASDGEYVVREVVDEQLLSQVSEVNLSDETVGGRDAVEDTVECRSPFSKVPRLNSPQASTSYRPSPVSPSCDRVQSTPIAATQVSRRLFTSTSKTQQGDFNEVLVIQSDTDEDETVPDPADSQTSESEDEMRGLENTPSPTKSGLKREQCRLVNKTRNLMISLQEKAFSVLQFIERPDDIKFYTGFKSYGVLHAFFQFFQEDAEQMFYLGSKNKERTGDREAPPIRPRKLSKLEEFFMTLVRLRKGYETQHLGHMFGLSQSHVSRICNSWIMLMANRLGQINFWPPERSGKHLLVPEKLQSQFTNLMVIVDATELFIERPTSATAQRECFSSYKNHVTAKAILGIDGNGTIIFYSRLYAGRTSDKKLFFHCGIVLLLKNGDLVQVDRGFDVGKELEDYGVSISIPDFLRGQAQLSKNQFKQSAEVAEVRVHVERAVRKVKEFEILRDIPLTLTPMLDAIWTTCCVLSNFTGSGYMKKPE